MPLTSEQLRQIEYHLRGEHLGETQRLTKVDFIAEMTDHYACALEEKLAKGQTWQQALQEIDASFEGRKGLRRMEKDFIKGYYEEFAKSYGKNLRAYFYKLPHVILTVIVCSLYMWLYINDHDWAIRLGYLLVFSAAIPSMVCLCLGIYYALVVGESRYTYILLHQGAGMFTHINLVNVLRVVDSEGQYILWTALPLSLLVAFAVANMILSTQMLYATYYRLKVSLKLR
ncbi:hypothetical protein [Rhodoflexus sp.]